MNVKQIETLIAQGHIVFPDDLIKYKSHPKFIAIQEQLSSIPQPEAIEAWNKIKSLTDNEVVNHLNDFIKRYASYPGNANMVEQARQRFATLTADVEKNDWDNVDTTSIEALLAHRRKYPSTSHVDEIDRFVWALIDKSSEPQIKRYIGEFPSGIYRSRAEDMLGSMQLWEGVSTDPDPVTLNDYIHEYPSSPFIEEAYALFDKVKEAELQKMREHPDTYSTNFFFQLLDEGIFSKQECIDAQVVTEQTYNLLFDPPQLPSIEQSVNANLDLSRDATDVFLFGIPSSGKTCLLMGLLGSRQLSYDNADNGAGGEYADALSLYRRYGKAPGSTFGNFVAQIKSTIFPVDNDKVAYPVNLIEMSGEEFAMKIAYNPDKSTSFEDLGTGATKILTNNHRKVIFIVIDPTADGLIKISSTREDGSFETKIVAQDQVIDKIVNMLEKNPKVLKHTNAIHFIMTKADILGSKDTRDEVARERILALYYNSINRLKTICHNYSINQSTHNNPTLFTFSLGKFFIGDLFEYDSSDADKLMGLLTSMCQGVKHDSSFFNKFKKTIGQ